MDTIICVAGKEHLVFAQEICQQIEESAKIRGTGIAKRDPRYIADKISEGKAVIALCNNQLAGFCYIEHWEEKKYIANSGLIIVPRFRGLGLAKKVKEASFALSKKLFPEAKLFGLTTSGAVMKINSDLGYKPVVFDELTKDESFWKGCQSCVNHDILVRNNRKYCLCTAMLYHDKKEESNLYKTNHQTIQL